MRILRRLVIITSALVLLTGRPADAQVERLCDPAFEDCRQLLIDHIRAEKVGLDVAFWFMEDSWIASEVINLHKANIPVRVLMDTDANASTPRNADRLAELKAAGVPMREKVSSGILHWKMMLFAGQGIVEFSGANFSSDAWVYAGAPYTNYVDEIIYFTGDSSVVDSFRTKFDDLWVDTTRYKNYANVTTPVRSYGIYPKDPELNFPPLESFASRSVTHYNAENTRLDVIIYRITDQRHTNAVIDAAGRGVPVRLITEPLQYRDPKRLWHSWNIDRLYMAGVEIRHRVHQGLNHQKLTIYYGQNLSVMGSSNWTSPSDNSQEEHNYFTTKPHIFTYAVNHFERKWTNSTGVAETGPFTPLPPDAAKTPTPTMNAASVATTGVTLKWDAGLWAHKYDIYFGTAPNPPLLIAGQMLGPSQSAGDLKQYTLPMTLNPGTTYYWKIVSKTMADQAATGPVWSFTTAGGPPPPPPGGSLPSPWTSQDLGAVGVAGTASFSNGIFTAAGSGADIWGSADALHYASQPISGDFDIVSRVETVSNVHPWTKAGVMIRDSLTPSSAQAMMLVSPGKGLAFQRRIANGGVSTSTAGGAGTAPVWVKLSRRGGTITAYRSSNGSAWTTVGSDTFTFGSTVYAGLGVSSHDNTRLATATFGSTTISASTPGGTVDTQAPTAQITSPSDGATVSGVVNVAVTAADNVGIARVEMLLNGTVVATDSSSPYQFAWDSRTGSNGPYNLQARAVDTSSNTGLSPIVQVTVSNTTATTDEIVLWTTGATAAGNWRLVNDPAAAGGLRMYSPDSGGAKITTPAASPVNYFEVTFNAVAGRAYRLWLRGKADADYYGNDSVFVQFSGSVTQAGAPAWRIGTTSATEVNLEECSGCRLSGWGWQDNGWGTGVLGPLVYFATTGPQTIRIQTREDGFSIDQIVLSPTAYLSVAPGTNKNDATILGKTQ